MAALRALAAVEARPLKPACTGQANGKRWEALGNHDATFRCMRRLWTILPIVPIQTTPGCSSAS